MSIYPWCGLLLGRNDRFQQQSLRIRATCHIGPVTTNDYQCIWAGCQWTGLGTAGGGWRRWWRWWGLYTPRRQRFNSPVAASKYHITSLQSTKSLTHHVSRDEINLLWEADSDTVCLEADWDRSQAVQYPEWERGTSGDVGVIWFIHQSNPLFFSSRLLICISKVTGVAETLLCMYVFGL